MADARELALAGSQPGGTIFGIPTNWLIIGGAIVALVALIATGED